MAVWYTVEKTEESMKDFIESNWAFHDFRIESVTYIRSKDIVKILLKYDTEQEGVLLVFDSIYDSHVFTLEDYAADYLYGCSIYKTGDNHFLWITVDDHSSIDRIESSGIKKHTTWVESDKLYWAITDGDGNPIEMPEDRIDQVWNNLGKHEKHHFDLIPFEGDLEEIQLKS